MPDGARKIRQLKIHRHVFLLLSLLSLFAVAFMTVMIWDYLALKKEFPRLAQMHKENKQQQEQLAALAQEIDGISKSLVELKKFDSKLRTMVNLDTRDDQTQFLGIGGSDFSSSAQNPQNEKLHRKLIRMMHQSLGDIKKEISTQRTEKIELSNFLESQKSILSCTPSLWPIRGWVSSGFGYRVSPFTNEKEFHSGIDVPNKTNSPIISPADGVVCESGWDYGYGKIIYINHGYGLKTKYAHLETVHVKVGQQVKRGQEIATVGSSGRTTGPHLHYEVHLNGVPVNPLRYILN